MGTIRDRTGREICEGDLLKTYHFTGARKKRYWLYHVVVRNDTDLCLDLVPTQYLAGEAFQNGGRCRLRQEYVTDSEIISGFGPGGILSFEDRPRVKRCDRAAAGLDAAKEVE